MATDAEKALKCETDFLSGVGEKLKAAKGSLLTGSVWKRAGGDDSDSLRALMAEHRNYDRERLKSLPANRRIELHGFDRRFVFWTKPTGVAIASVLSPLEHYASSAKGDAPPIGLGELTEHLQQLVKNKRADCIIGVCSPSGFTEEAREARINMPNVTIVLVEPNEAGGWVTSPASEDVDPSLQEIFDPEGAKHKLERVQAVVEEHSADLLTGGLSASSLARSANLPTDVVREGLERMAAADPELKFTQKDGESLLYRGAPVRAEEKRSMNVVERIRQLFSHDGDEAEKVNLLAERRAGLSQRRDRIYDDIGKLEKKEAQLLDEGKASKSQVPRRRLAAQLAQLRKDIGRQNSTAAMLNKQIDIISTDIHNLTLIQQGEMAKLPDSTELTENAVRAEEMLESLAADADLVSGLETGMEQVLASEEELAILREFEESDKAESGQETREAAGPPPTQARTDTTLPPEPRAEEPPSAAPSKDRSPADPEPT